MDISIVKEGAVLECSLGTKTSILKVPVFHGASLEGGNMANISDSIGSINITSFCKCKRSEPYPDCIPQTVMKWLNGQQNCILDGELALLKICIIPCIHGGIIKILESGQSKC